MPASDFVSALLALAAVTVSIPLRSVRPVAESPSIASLPVSFVPANATPGA